MSNQNDQNDTMYKTLTLKPQLPRPHNAPEYKAYHWVNFEINRWDVSRRQVGLISYVKSQTGMVMLFDVNNYSNNRSNRLLGVWWEKRKWFITQIDVSWDLGEPLCRTPGCFISWTTYWDCRHDTVILVYLIIVMYNYYLSCRTCSEHADN